VAADYNFETVVREFYDDVYRFACSQAKADADAADLTQ
jgi:DNA-directed RNA polymerase specialized sigma24 family protein